MKRPNYETTGNLKASTGMNQLSKWSPNTNTMPNAVLQQYVEGGPFSLLGRVKLPIDDVVPQWRLFAFRGKEAIPSFPPARAFPISSMTKIPHPSSAAAGGGGAAVGGSSSLSSSSSRLEPSMSLTTQSAYLFGRDPICCDVSVEHPSCSTQHAVIYYSIVRPKKEQGDQTERLVSATATDLLVPSSRKRGRIDDGEVEGDRGGVGAMEGEAIDLCVEDLGSTNGTFVNRRRLGPFEAVPLCSGDVIQFGMSSRTYVLQLVK